MLSLLGIGFVVVRLGVYAGDLEGIRPDYVQTVLLAVLATVYGTVSRTRRWRSQGALVSSVAVRRAACAGHCS